MPAPMPLHRGPSNANISESLLPHTHGRDAVVQAAVGAIVLRHQVDKRIGRIHFEERPLHQPRDGERAADPERDADEREPPA